MNLKQVVITSIILVSLSLSWGITRAVYADTAGVQKQAQGGTFYLDSETVEQIQSCPDCSEFIDWNATEK